MAQETEQTEIEWYTTYKQSQFSKYEKSTLPCFQYGLSILIKPQKELCFEGAASPSIRRVINSHQAHVNYDITGECKPFFETSWMHPNDNHQWYYLHEAQANDIVHIIIPKNTTIKEPILIDELYEQNAFTTLLIHAQTGSSATILCKKQGDAQIISEHIKILAEPASKIEFFSIQQYSMQTSFITHRSSTIQKDAQVHFKDLSLGAAYLKSDTINALKEQGADGTITALFAGRENQRFDIYTASVHQNQNTTSDIVTKGVLNNSAKALSRGLVRIEENAAQSNGYEQQDCLLLSKEAEADAIPNLEIHNHDVKCSHGSTVGQVDLEQVFYLQSRGLSEEQAKMKIIEGYFIPLLDTFSDEELKEQIHHSIVNTLEGTNAN